MGIFILKKIPPTQEEFQSSQNTPNGTIMMDTCHHTFVHIHRTYNTKSEHAVRLGMALRVSAGSPIITKAPLQWGLWTIGGCAYVGAGSGRETSVLALNLSFNLKLMPPKNFLLKIQPSSLKIYVLPLTCQISKLSLKKKKKNRKIL